jgi:hypothetical protein
MAPSDEDDIQIVNGRFVRIESKAYKRLRCGLLNFRNSTLIQNATSSQRFWDDRPSQTIEEMSVEAILPTYSWSAKSASLSRLAMMTSAAMIFSLGLSMG